MKKVIIAMIAVTVTGFVACTPPAGNENSKMGAANMETTKHVYALMNEGKMDSLDAYIAADFIEHNPDPMQKGTGLAAMKEMMGMYKMASPDMKMEAISMMADGDMVMVHASVWGTNTGAMGPNMPATNKAWKVDMYEKLKIADGKCVERWGVFDTFSMMSQLGMMPSPGAAPEAPAAPAAKM